MVIGSLFFQDNLDGTCNKEETRVTGVGSNFSNSEE